TRRGEAAHRREARAFMLTIARAREGGAHNRACQPCVSAATQCRPFLRAVSVLPRNFSVEITMKTVVGTLIVVGSLVLPFAASAQVQNAGPDGSTGANSVGSSFTSPGPSAGAGSGTSGAGASTQVQNAGPDGSTGANSVGAAAPAPAARQSAGGAAQSGRTHQ